MIVLLGGEKGGTGKSTLATNLCVWLAHQKHDVLLLDADRQSTSANWASARAEDESLPVVHCVQNYGNLVPALKDLESRYEHIVVDAGGRDSEELRSALVACDRLFVPLRASQSDLWTVEHMAELVRLAKSLNPYLEAFSVLSMAATNPRIRESEEAAQMLADYDILPLVSRAIHDRKAYRDAMCEGKGVVEKNDAKAKAEFEQFAMEVINEQVQAGSRQNVA